MIVPSVTDVQRLTILAQILRRSRKGNMCRHSSAYWSAVDGGNQTPGGDDMNLEFDSPGDVTDVTYGSSGRNLQTTCSDLRYGLGALWRLRMNNSYVKQYLMKNDFQTEKPAGSQLRFIDNKAVYSWCFRGSLRHGNWTACMLTSCGNFFCKTSSQKCRHILLSHSCPFLDNAIMFLSGGMLHRKMSIYKLKSEFRCFTYYSSMFIIFLEYEYTNNSEPQKLTLHPFDIIHWCIKIGFDPRAQILWGNKL